MTGVQTCALPISRHEDHAAARQARQQAESVGQRAAQARRSLDELRGAISELEGRLAQLRADEQDAVRAVRQLEDEHASALRSVEASGHS